MIIKKILWLRGFVSALLITTAVAVISMIPGSVIAGSYDGKRILFIDSYHTDYPWSAGVSRGVEEVVKGTGAVLKIHRMNTKRNKAEAFKKKAALEAKAVIEAFRPDVVVACDDNASKYLIKPYFANGKLPFVFCGVNWDASGYGFPLKNVTGMIEVNDVVGLVEVLRQISGGKRVGFIADDTLTTHKEVEHYKRLFDLHVTPYYAKDFEEWKRGYVEIQSKVDCLIFYSFNAIEKWDAEEALKFVHENTKIPTGTFQTGTMPYSLIGYLKVAEEQGRWATQTALRILDGTSPSSIPLTTNQEGHLLVNLKLALSAGIDVPYALIEVAEVIE